MLWIAVAAGLAEPVAVNPISWWSPDDMPAYVQRQGVTRRLLTRTTVQPDGKIQSCAVEVSSGDVALDTLTCEIILQRGKFLPAHWMDGSTVYGVHRQTMTWLIGERSQNKYLPVDFDLTVNQLPRGFKSPVIIWATLALDEHGHPLSCIQEPPNNGNRNTDQRLLAITCSTLMKDFKGTPAIDEAGNSIRSVQNASVRFATSP